VALKRSVIHRLFSPKTALQQIPRFQILQAEVNRLSEFARSRYFSPEHFTHPAVNFEDISHFDFA
jgi:hypothetical protein